MAASARTTEGDPEIPHRRHTSKLRLERAHHAGYLLLKQGLLNLVRCVFMHFLMDPDVCREPAHTHGARAARARDFVNFRKFSPAWRARGARAWVYL